MPIGHDHNSRKRAFFKWCYNKNMDVPTPPRPPEPSSGAPAPQIPPEFQVLPGGSICPACANPVPPDFLFCPHCGKQLKEAPLPTSVIAQTGIYLLSVLLPPLGLWPGIKYVKHSDPKAQNIGWIAIILTVLSTVITTWLTFQFLNAYLAAINSAMNGL